MSQAKNGWTTLLFWLVVLGTVTLMPIHGAQLGLADPGQYGRPPVRRTDVREFWRAALSQLAQWPAQVTRNERGDELRFQGLAGRTCLAAYSVPPNSTVTAAFVHIVEGGNLQRHLLHNDGCAHLCINWYPSDPGCPWNPQGLPDRQAYILVEAIVDAARAVEVLLAQPEVLADRVTLVGEGPGGAVAVALAALMPERVASVIAYEPWPIYHYPLNQMMAPSPQVAAALAAYETRYPRWREAIRRSTSQLDIIKLAPFIEAPTLIVLAPSAPGDRATPGRVLYSQLCCEKELVLAPVQSQQRPGMVDTTNELCRQWARRALARRLPAVPAPASVWGDLLVPEEMPQPAPLETDQVSVTVAAAHLNR